MSDTPETDNFIVSAGYVRTDHQWRTFARKLERGRNSLQDQRDFCMGEIERLRKERDEAVKSEISAIESWDEERKLAKREGERVLEAREKYLAMRALSNNATEVAEKYKQERDEARENLTQTQKAWTDACIERTKFAIERDEARQAFATATNHAIAAREMLRRIMDWSPCLCDYEPYAQHLKWQSDAHAARKFLEAAK